MPDERPLSDADRTPPDDWRRQGQERYLNDAVLTQGVYSPLAGNDHDHCEFCAGKFGGGGELTWGYTTADRYWWIRPRCFEDFRNEFGWRDADED